MHLLPTPDQFRALVGRGIDGPVVMLNLLRHRAVADYSDAPELAPDREISGREAYRRYGEAVVPLLARVGGRVLFGGAGGANLIGPTDEHWDECLLVRYPTLEAFSSMTSSPEYLAIVGHRMAALADSRLLPLVPGDASV